MSLKRWIKEGNDCTGCPCAWSEQGLEDWDGGCHLDRDNEYCRLPMFARKLILRRALYLKAHEYDGYEDWHEKLQAIDDAIEDAIKDALSGCKICRKIRGEFIEVCQDGYIGNMVWSARQAYEDNARKSIPKRWAELVKDTIAIPVDYIKSFVIGG